MLLSEILNLLYILGDSVYSNTSLANLTPLQKMESEHILKSLESMSKAKKFNKRVSTEPKAVLSNEEKQLILNLLESRWSRIQGTNNCYTQNSDLPANKICIDLAKGLASSMNRPYFELLMPTLKGIANPVTLERYTNNSHVCEFVISDDNTLLIHIDSAFKQFECTGTMTKSDNTPLSKHERNSVINHTKNTKMYYDFLVEKNDIKTETNTLGYEVQELIRSLEVCAAEDNIKDKYSQLANIKQHFGNFLSSLPNGQLNFLYDSFFIDDKQQHINFKYLWNLLSETREIDTKQIAALFKNILDTNFVLYLVSSTGKLNQSRVFSAHEQYEKISTAYYNEIQREHTVFRLTHAKSSELKFVKSILSDDQGVSLYCTTKTFFKYIMKLDAVDRKRCFTFLLQSESGKSYLKRSIKTQPVKEQKKLNTMIEEINNQIPLPLTNTPLTFKQSVIYIDCEESDEFQARTEKQSNTTGKEEITKQGKKRSTENTNDPNTRLKKKSKTKKSQENTLMLENNSSEKHYLEQAKDDDSQVEQQFELSQAEIGMDIQENPVDAIIFDTNNMSFERTKKSHKKKRNNSNSVEIEDAAELDEKAVHKKYTRAKRKLGEIQDTYKNDDNAAQLIFQNDNKPNINAERKAARAVEKKVKPLSKQIIQHYSNSGSFEGYLQAIKVTIEFINDYPVKKNIFESELDILNDCLKICDLIINSTEENSKIYRQEALDLKGIINTRYIPIIHYNYAIFHHRKVSIQASTMNDKNVDEINGIIKTIKYDIDYLNDAMALYEELGDEFRTQDIVLVIKKCLAKSFEDLGDYRNNLLDVSYASDQNSTEALKLIETIKRNYQKSFDNLNNDTIWLSIRTCQYKLIEIHLANNNIDSALAELGTLIAAIEMKHLSVDDMPVEEETKIKLETIETMLYACNKAYSLTQDEQYKLKAKTYLKTHDSLLTASLNTEIIGYINELFLIQFEIHNSIEEILSQLFSIPEPSLKSVEIFDSNIVMNIAEDDIYTAKIVTVQTANHKVKGISADSKDISPLPTTNASSVTKFSLFSPVQKYKTPIDCNYQYTPKDIEQILAARMLPVPNIHVMATAQLYNQLQGNGIAQVMQQFIQEHPANLSGKDNTLLIPVQNGSNWSGLIVRMNGTRIVDLTYFNNLPNKITTSMQLSAIKKQLIEQNLITDAICIGHKTTDKYPCTFIPSELLLIENFCFILNNQDFDPNNSEDMHQRNMSALQSYNHEYYKTFGNNESGSKTTIHQQISSRLFMQNRLFQTTGNQQQANNSNGITQENMHGNNFNSK